MLKASNIGQLFLSLFYTLFLPRDATKKLEKLNFLIKAFNNISPFYTTRYVLLFYCSFYKMNKTFFLPQRHQKNRTTNSDEGKKVKKNKQLILDKKKFVNFVIILFFISYIPQLTQTLSGAAQQIFFSLL